MESISNLMKKLAQLVMAQQPAGDIQLPTEREVDPRLVDSLPPAAGPAGAIEEKRRARVALGLGTGRQ